MRILSPCSVTIHDAETQPLPSACLLVVITNLEPVGQALTQFPGDFGHCFGACHSCDQIAT